MKKIYLSTGKYVVQVCNMKIIDNLIIALKVNP